MASKPQLSVIYLLLLVVLIAVALVLGYGAGHFSTLGERVTTTMAITNTSTTTATSTALSFSTLTRTKTETSTTTLTTAVMEPPHVLPPPANSSAVIRSRFFLNGSLFLMVSIDKSVYKMGEAVHFKGTLTNLTPEDITLRMDFPSVQVRNSSTVVTYPGSPSVWRLPEFSIVEGLGNIWFSDVTVESGKTVTVDMFTAAWNMTGIHVEHRTLPGGSSSWATYDDHPVPPNQYVASWYARMSMWDTWDAEFTETIPFEITK